MKRPIWYTWLLLLAPLLVIAACAPQATPPPGVASVASPSPSVPASRLAQAISSEPSSRAQAEGDTAWDKVVEAAKKERKFNLYAYSFTGDTGLAIAKAFGSKYGLDVDVVTGRGAEFLERLKTERRVGKMVADFVESSPTHTLNMKKDGLTDLTVDLSVLREKEVWALHPLSFDPEGHTIRYTYYLNGVQVNTRLVKPGEEPTSWYDLLQPRWKGQILANDPTISTGLYTYILPLLEAGVLSKDYVARLGEQELRLERSAVQVAERLSRGEYPVSIASTSSAGVFMAEGAPIKMVPLKEGHSAAGLAVTLIKGSPHPNAARLFMNWLLSAEGQSIVLKPMASTSIRNDVPNYLPEAGRLKNVKIIPDSSETDLKVAEAFRTKLWVELLKKGK